jgi:RNA ligase (TIGR02306 family)
MSNHIIPVIKLDNISIHPNADSLEIVQIFGYQCVVRKDQFHINDLVAYIEPDYLVPVSEPEFSFLAAKAKEGFVRITAMRLRGENSFGLVIPARPGWEVGDNVLDTLGIKRYEPFIPGANFIQTENEVSPNVYAVKYDMENYRRYNNIIQIGEEVCITEKVNGSNARFTHTNNDDIHFHVGSHTCWKRRNPQNMWWKAAAQYDLENKLQKYPDHIFYGELYGNVGGFRYGFKDNNIALAFFDIMYKGVWLDVPAVKSILEELDLPMVPVLYQGQWKEEFISMSDGQTTIPNTNHIREGIVIKPIKERVDPSIGRVILKIVGMDYLEGKKKR